MPNDLSDELAILRKAAAAPGDRAPLLIYADWLDEHERHEEATAIRSKFGFERRTVIEAAWDRRSDDPRKNFGVHGCNLIMNLHGPKGAISWIVFTNWMLDDRHPAVTPTPCELMVHSLSPTPQNDDDPREDCRILGGGTCYANRLDPWECERMWDVLRRDGDAGVWRELQKHYENTFDGAGHKFPGYTPFAAPAQPVPEK